MKVVIKTNSVVIEECFRNIKNSMRNYMINEKCIRKIKNLSQNDKYKNSFCDLRFCIDQQKTLQKIINLKIFNDDIHSSYFPQSVETICNRNMAYYSGENYSGEDYSIHKLLSWGTELMDVFSKDACRYIQLKNNYENALFAEKYDLALEILDNIEKKVCSSIWVTYQRFLVLNFMNKQGEVQKLIDGLQTFMQQPSFVIYVMMYYAKMADSSIDFEEYNMSLEPILDSSDKKNILWKYFNFKLNLSQSKDIQGIKSALIFDEQVSFIDYYETYIETMQILCGEERYASLVRECVQSLYPKNNDFRLRNLHITMIKIDDEIIIDEKACELIEYYTLGKYDRVKKEIVDYVNIHSNNFEIHRLFTKVADSNNQIEIPHNKLWNEINNIYLFNYDVRSSLHIIGNYYKLFYGTSWKNKILCIMVRKLNYEFGSNVLNRSILNDLLCTPLFYQCIKSKEEQLSFLMKFQHNTPITTQLMSYMLTDNIDINAIAKIDSIRWKYYETKSLIKRGNFLESISKCCQILDDFNETKDKQYYEERIRRTLYNCYLAVNELEKAMNLYVDSFLIKEEFVIHMDLSELVKKLDDDNDNVIKGNICRPIVCSLYYKIANDEITVAYLDYMESKGCKTTTELLEKYNYLDEKDVLFLNKVCSQSLLMKDYVSKTQFGGSAAELRAEVLRVLIDLDKKNDRVKEYMSELNSIYKATQLQKKINSFNHNRIFIDTENLYLYMKKDLDREFIKYKTVQEMRNGIGIKKDKSIEMEGLSFVLEQYWDNHRFFSNIIEKIKKEYLNESPYSLECFLSTRIRHNFCNDNLKKVFEAEKLFCKKMKDDSADYIVNDYWKDKLSKEEYNVIIEELSRFSQSIDSKIQEIKDKWMRIKQDEISEGIFDYRDFTKSLLRYVVISEDVLDNVTGYFEYVVKNLDYWTGTILEVIRNKIDTDLKAYYSNSIDQLEKKIKKIQFNSITKSEMLRNIELSKAKYIEDIEAFKDVFNMEHENYPDFTMEELIEFCSEVEKDMNNQFKSVKVIPNIKYDSVFCGNIFPYLVDIIGILIRNAVEHSQITQMDELSIGIDIIPYQDSNSQEEVISRLGYAKPDNIVVFAVSNNLSAVVDEDTIRSKVGEKINDIYSGKFKDQSSQEGGSGLFKTARTIYYGLHSSCEYCFEVENGIFKISLSMDLGQYLRKE